jgi:hypothetical protein
MIENRAEKTRSCKIVVQTIMDETQLFESYDLRFERVRQIGQIGHIGRDGRYGLAWTMWTE